jgi:peptidoglycan/LPS O-acetylase OafA/YrhL
MNDSEKSPAIVNRPGGGERVHLPFLEGIRGITALYVVLHHFLSWSSAGVRRDIYLAIAWTALGHFAVHVFIVLSGFSLMLPIAYAPDHRLRGGISHYLMRRARRILPPYFAALTGIEPTGLLPEHTAGFRA